MSRLRNKFILGIGVAALILTMSARADVQLAHAQGTAPYRGERPEGVLTKVPDNLQDYPIDEDQIPLPDNGGTETVVETGIPVEMLETSMASDSSMREGQTVVLAADEVIDKDYFAAGEIVRVSGTVNGDVFVAGGQVIIDGTVNGSVLAAGGNVEITGLVSENIRVAGGQVIVSSNVGNNLTVVGGSVSLPESASIGRNLVVGAGSVSFNAPVTGDATIGAGSIAMLGAAAVGGDFTYATQNDVVFNDAQVAGTVIRKDIPKTHQAEAIQKEDIEKATSDFAMFIYVVSLISMLILGLLMVYTYPRFMQSVADEIKGRPWRSIGVGFVALIVMPLVAVLLMVTIVGFPLGILTLLGYVIALYFGQFFVMFWIGKEITVRLNKNWHDGVAFTLGLVVYTLIKIIPVVGWVAHAIAMLAGLGALLTRKIELLKSLKAKKII